VLEPSGWELVRTVGSEGQWRRPGKEGPGISATTNYEETDLLYVFSTSTPFEPERGYTKFAAYAVLNFGGDFRAAARELAQRGYCDEPA
jgi:putative DNA primase/helicase